MFTLLIALGNLSILEIPHEYTFFAIPRLLAFFSMPLDYGYHLWSALQACQSLVFDGVIDVWFLRGTERQE